MADLRNADPSNPCTKKKNPLIDEDFGTDFLTSWNSSKVHKDALDFDVEAVPRKNKKSFNFDELDDFGLGPDFDKLSSFGIPDLDFSKPLKKTEKASDKSGKDFVQETQDPHSDKFSFAFDFKGLDVFEPDASMENGGKQVSKTMTETTPANSAEQKKDLGIKCKSITNTEALERSETEVMANSDSISTSKSAQLADSIGLHDSTPLSDTRMQVDISHKAQQAVEKQISSIEEKTKQFITETEQREQSNEICLYQTKSCTKSVARELVLLSRSSNESAKDAFPKVQKEFISSGSLKANFSNEEESSIRPQESLKSRDTSPVNSCNSRNWQPKGKVESSDNANNFQNHEVNQIKIIGGSRSSNEYTNVIEDAQNAYNKEIAREVSHGMNNSCEREDPTSKHLPSPLNPGSKLPSAIPTEGKNRLSLQLKPLNKPETTTFHQKSKLLPLQQNGRCNMKMNSNCSYPAIAKRDCNINVEGTVEQKCSISSCDDKLKTKVESNVTGSRSSDMGSDDLCTELLGSNLIGKTTSIQNAKNSIPKIVSSVLMSPQMKTREDQDFTQKDMKKLRTSSFMNLRLSKPTGNTTSSLILKGRNLNARPEGRLKTIVAGFDTTNQCALLNSSLKRKTPETTETDPTLIPMKHMESSSLERRASLEVFPNDGIDEVLRSEDREHFGYDAHADNLTYIASATEIENIVDLELPASIENDGNIEKAEAFSKELDDICSMLRKKHEEAKDLLVRAIVNNNSLLMLDRPMIQSKICALQRFAKSLRSREYWKN